MRVTRAIAILVLMLSGAAWAARAPQTAGSAATAELSTHSILAPIGVYQSADQIKDPPPLLKAILEDRVDIATRLLKHGASATAVYRGVPYFATAAGLRPCDPKMVNLLIAHGAEVNGVWVTLRARNHGPVLDTYVSPLAAAASAGQSACVATLMRHGADPNIVSLEGVTPLGAAAASSYCKPEMIDFMIKHGAHVNFTPSLSDLPPKVVGHILSHLGNMPESRKWTLASQLNPIVKAPPLDLAVAYDHLACARALVKNGADLDAHGMDGSLLMDAVSVGHSPEITKMLIHDGADLHARNKLGETALFMGADDFGSPKIFRDYCLECARLLVQAGAEVDAVDNAGNTPLVYAAGGEDTLPLVKLLVDAGANVNYRNPKTDITPLSSAQSAHNAAVATYLIRHGANAPADAADGKPTGTSSRGIGVPKRNPAKD